MKHFLGLIILTLITTINLLGQNNYELLKGEWIRISTEQCGKKDIDSYIFPNQSEFVITESNIWIRYSLDNEYSTKYSYRINKDSLNVFDNSQYKIVSVDKSFLKLKQIINNVCFLHTFKREQDILDKVKSEMEYQVFRQDTFYCAYVYLYPEYLGEGRLYDNTANRFEKKLEKIGAKNVEINIFLKGSGQVVNVTVDNCKDENLSKKIITYLMHTNGKWKMPRIYKEPLNQIYTIKLNQE